MFTTAIVKKPGESIIRGLTNSNVGEPDFKLALQQHQAYVDALIQCGLEVIELEPSEKYPDSVFIEDAALCTPYCAILTRPGVASRQGEERMIRDTLSLFYTDIAEIKSPGTVEAGDIMMVGSQYYIGISGRTNIQGAEQMIEILEHFGLSGSMVKLTEMLHLKSGLSYLGNNNLLISGEFLKNPIFNTFNQIQVPVEESYAANSVWINGNVLVPSSYPKTKATIQQLGYKVLELDVSEYWKLDGGLSCLSLRF